MSDIDFDELDKAVNNLMGKAPATDSDDEPKAKTLTISSTLKPGEKPVYDKLGEVAKGIGSETLITQGERTTVEDLHSKLPTTQLATAELDTIQAGFDPDVHTSTPPEVPAPEQPAIVKRPMRGRSMDVVRTSPTKLKSTMMPSLVSPDRLSKHEVVESVPSDQNDDAPATDSDESVTGDESKQSEITNEPYVEAPRLTPFLPDTKVEKRPLGGNGDQSSDKPQDSFETSDTASPSFGDAPKSDEQHSDTDHDSVHTTDTNENDDSKNNQGLDTDEKVTDAQDDASLPIDATKIEQESLVDEQKLQEIESAEAAERNIATAASVRAVESGDTEKLSAGSISQQYQSKPAESTVSEAGAIYDVKDYHQALGRPTKQKSGWGVVLLILVIIIACALIGAAVYFILGSGL